MTVQELIEKLQKEVERRPEAKDFKVCYGHDSVDGILFLEDAACIV
jgi:hypothetical protein